MGHSRETDETWLQQIHVIPTFDGKEHLDDTSCWCEPCLDYRDPHTGKTVWVHRCLQ
jgi:hypothetical protein